MSPVRNDKSWCPTASIENLRMRANFIAQIRSFFARKGVMEVETPLLGKAAATDPFLHILPVRLSCTEQTYFLQTSPEFSMKRLLAAGSGPIYQLCKAFRDDESGRLHNPEFTLLEWYQPAFDHHALMDEMDELLQLLVNTPPAKRLSYGSVFMETLALNPHAATLEELKNCAQQHSIEWHVAPTDLLVDDWLDILMTHCIEPKLGFDAPTLVYDYPASKAALAKVREGVIPVAERFELFWQGVELANGYHELTDPAIQQLRFKEDNKKRKSYGYPLIPVDTELVSALQEGLPDSAGVALGIDRLLMLKLGEKNIREVISFTIDRA